MKKFLITTAMFLMAAQLYAQAYSAGNDSGWGARDDFSIKPTFNENRHRCSDADIKKVTGNNIKIGSWSGEYTITYMPNAITRDGDIVKVYARMLPTYISQSAPNLDEGFIEVVVFFNTRSKTMVITQAQSFSCNRKLIRMYQQTDQWSPISSNPEFVSFYRNVVSKVK